MKIQQPVKRHACNRTGGGRDWSHCTACNGRIHLQGCTSRRDPAKDCCPERHQRLYEQGHKVGLVDSGIPMLPY